MRDTELYKHLLGLEKPWTVSRVELGVKEQRVDVWAEHAEGESWPCPECGVLLAVNGAQDLRKVGEIRCSSPIPFTR